MILIAFRHGLRAAELSACAGTGSILMPRSCTFGGDELRGRGNVGIIRSPVRASILPDPPLPTIYSSLIPADLMISHLGTCGGIQPQ
jgi:hypothetical protein